jgi:hypothetical protein
LVDDVICGFLLGHLLRRVLEAYPKVTGILFDQNETINRAKHMWEMNHSDLMSRTQFVPGSFFIPSTFPKFIDGDCIMMRMILHDWNDEMSVEILKNIRRKIGNIQVTVAIIDVSLSVNDFIPQKYFADLMMMSQHGAKERYHEEWVSLMAQSGFKLSTTVPTRSLYSVMVAVPI